MTHTHTVLILLILLACLMFGCARPQPGQAPAPAATYAAPTPPQGMRLGPAYFSALNEPCHELIPLHAPFEAVQTICHRNGVWDVLPPVLAAVPGTNPTP